MQKTHCDICGNVVTEAGKEDFTIHYKELTFKVEVMVAAVKTLSPDPYIDACKACKRLILRLGTVE